MTPSLPTRSGFSDRIGLPEELRDWMQVFVEKHYTQEEFKKRRRDRVKTELVEEGRGDARVRQAADVYRAPGAMKPKTTLH